MQRKYTAGTDRRKAGRFGSKSTPLSGRENKFADARFPAGGAQREPQLVPLFFFKK